MPSPNWVKDPSTILVALRKVNRRYRRRMFDATRNNANVIAMRAFRGLRLADGRPAICRNHQIQRNMQLCWVKNGLSAARADALLEATILVQVPIFKEFRGPAFSQNLVSESIGLYNDYTYSRLRAEGVSLAAIRLLKSCQRRRDELDSKFFKRVNRRLETKLLVLAAIAADRNQAFLLKLGDWTKETIESHTSRALSKLDMDEDLWAWFDRVVRLPLYQTDDEGFMLKLLGPDFEGRATTQPEVQLAMAELKKRLGTSDVAHSQADCPKCLGDSRDDESVLGHLFEISYEFAYSLERQTNFKWSDQPVGQKEPYLRRLPSIDESREALTFGLQLEMP